MKNDRKKRRNFILDYSLEMKFFEYCKEKNIWADDLDSTREFIEENHLKDYRKYCSE